MSGSTLNMNFQFVYSGTSSAFLLKQKKKDWRGKEKKKENSERKN